MPDPTPRRRWQIPPDVTDATRLRADASRRRVALVAAGCQTYTVGMKGGHEAIVCLCCGLGSVHPKDLEERYCGFCHAWHAEWREADHA